MNLNYETKTLAPTKSCSLGVTSSNLLHINYSIKSSNEHSYSSTLVKLGKSNSGMPSRPSSQYVCIDSPWNNMYTHGYTESDRDSILPAFALVFENTFLLEMCY